MVETQLLVTISARKENGGVCILKQTRHQHLIVLLRAVALVTGQPFL